MTLPKRNVRQRRLLTPKVYEVGVDISQEQYLEAVQKIADWFAEFRTSTKEPAALAKRYLDACIAGVKPTSVKGNNVAKGEPWYDMASSTLAARVRSSCRFDIDKMEPIRSGKEKNQIKRRKEAARKKKNRLDQREDANIPEELKAEMRGTAKYGDNPHIFLSTEESKVWQEMYDGYLKEHPELRSVNGRTELMALCDLQIQLERLRFRLLKNDQRDLVHPDMMTGITKQLADFKKALGIHPEQLAKRADKDASSSIGAAVARMTSLTEHWPMLRLRYWTEELIQAVQQCVTLKADGTGYQIDEFEFFARTRCRLVKCPNCGIEILGGFRLKEVILYLVRKGHLKPLPPNPDGSEREVTVEADQPVQVDDEFAAGRAMLQAIVSGEA